MADPAQGSCLAHGTIPQPSVRRGRLPMIPFFWVPSEIFLGRRYSGATTAKSKSCQAFLQAYVAEPPPPIIPFGFPFPRPSSSSTSTDRVLQPVRACVFYFIFIYRRVLISSLSDERGRRRGIKWSLRG